MRHVQLLAQATGVPNNGASNATDFQPPTRNPQVPAHTQQQAGGVQDTSSQQVLSDPNLRIQIPQGVAEAAPTPPPAAAGGINWLAVALVTAVLIVAIELLIRRREKRPALKAVPAATVPEATAVAEKPSKPKKKSTKSTKKIQK